MVLLIVITPEIIEVTENTNEIWKDLTSDGCRVCFLESKSDVKWRRNTQKNQENDVVPPRRTRNVIHSKLAQL